MFFCRIFLQTVFRFISTVFLVSTLVFFFIYLLPGDPVSRIAGFSASSEVRFAIAEKLQLNRPIILQYFLWMRNVLLLDFGQSYFTAEWVKDLIAQRALVSVLLAAISLLFAVVSSLVSIAICRPQRRQPLVRSIEVVLIALPPFWLALVLVYFNFWGRGSVWSSSVFDSMIIPILVLGSSFGAVLFRFLRAAIHDEWNKSYVVFFRSMGIPQRRMILRHVLPNVLPGYIILIGVQTGYLLGGSVILERMFSLPGMGNLLVSAVLDLDYPIVLGVVMIISGLSTLINSLTEAVGTRLSFSGVILESS